MKYIKSIFVFIILLAISAGYYGWHTWYKKPIEPTKNPNPKYFVTIRGNIDPELEKPIYMAFWVSYAGYSPNCSTTLGGLSGVEAMHAKVDFYQAKPDKQGDYLVKIPIDAYEAGACGWKIARINYTAENAPILDQESQYAIQTLMGFGDKNNPNELPGLPPRDVWKSTAISCNNSVETCKGGFLFGLYEDKVSRTKSYHFIQNFKP